MKDLAWLFAMTIIYQGGSCVLKTKSGKPVEMIGQGTWYLGENRRHENDEVASLKVGINNGMNLIDTAEMYGDGGAEVLVSKVISGMEREDLYIVSKIYPHNANKDDYLYACENSLKRLNTSYIDLYLLHWKGRTPLEEVVECMEDLKNRGMILNWGVSNFDILDMQQLFEVKNGNNCLVNQVLYHLGSRGIEYNLIPWLQANGVYTMAYCPLAQGGDLRGDLFSNKVVNKIAHFHGATAAQIMLAFILSKPMVIPIPRTRKSERAIENAGAINIDLSDEDLLALNKEFPAPTKKLPLDIQ